MKVGDYAMLRLHKGYSIPSSVGVTKKLTQQYVGPFYVFEKVGQLVYKLDVPLNWRVHLVFSVAQLETASSSTNDLFHYPRPHMPSAVFVDDDTDATKSFKIDRLFNKQTIKKGRGRAIEYLVYWTGYGLEWDRWYNIKDLDNATNLVRDDKDTLAQQECWYLSCWGGSYYGLSLLPLFIHLLPSFIPYPYSFPFFSLILYIIKPGSG